MKIALVQVAAIQKISSSLCEWIILKTCAYTCGEHIHSTQMNPKHKCYQKSGKLHTIAESNGYHAWASNVIPCVYVCRENMSRKWYRQTNKHIHIRITYCIGNNQALSCCKISSSCCLNAVLDAKIHSKWMRHYIDTYMYSGAQQKLYSNLLHILWFALCIHQFRHVIAKNEEIKQTHILTASMWKLFCTLCHTPHTLFL